MEPQVLLVLLAVRARGGQGAPAAAEEFKALKKAVAIARAQGWIEEQQAEVSVTSKTGKVSKKKAPVLSLSAAGNQVLQQTAHAEALAATAAQHAQNLHKSLESDRQTLRAEVLAALSAKGKGKPADPAKDLQEIAKTLTALGQRVESLERTMHGAADSGILDKIDQAFAALEAKLTPALGQGASPAKAPTYPSPPSSLRDTLHQAYQTLCQYFEFEDGLVKMPNLYHEARKKMPALTVEAFHRELESLWTQRVLELKVLNEVRSATEPDKGIRRDDNLYYFVYWPRP